MLITLRLIIVGYNRERLEDEIAWPRRDTTIWQK